MVSVMEDMGEELFYTEDDVNFTDADMLLWYETPGSEILHVRIAQDAPDRDNYLMEQQGFFSGKNEGDLDSVPGYYGATASYKFVQNARALTQHRVVRHARAVKAGAEAPVQLLPYLTPSEARVAAYENAKAVLDAKPVLEGPARGEKFKFAGEFGAIKKPKLITPKIEAPKGKFVRDHIGNWVWKSADPGVARVVVQPAGAAAAHVARNAGRQ